MRLFLLSFFLFSFTHTAFSQQITASRNLLNTLDKFIRNCDHMGNEQEMDEFISNFLKNEPVENVQKSIPVNATSELAHMNSFWLDKTFTPLEYLLTLRNNQASNKYSMQTGTILNEWKGKQSCYAKLIGALSCFQAPNKTKDLIETFVEKCDFEILPLIRHRLVIQGCGNSELHLSHKQITDSSFLEKQTTVEEKRLGSYNKFSDAYFKTKVNMMVNNFIDNEAFPLKHSEKLSSFLKGFKPNLIQNREPPPLIINKVKAFENIGQVNTTADPSENIIVRSHLRILLFQEIQADSELKNILTTKETATIISEFEKNRYLYSKDKLKSKLTEKIIEESQGEFTTGPITNDPWAFKNWARKLKQNLEQHTLRKWDQAFIEIRDEINETNLFAEITSLNNCDSTLKWLHQLQRGNIQAPVFLRNKTNPILQKVR